MIHYGIQDNTWAYKHIDDKGVRTLRLEPVKEKYLHFVMPWKRNIYSLATDGIERIRPKFAIYWHKHSYSRCTFLRMGWC
jgi:hypothetical protein